MPSQVQRSNPVDHGTNSAWELDALIVIRGVFRIGGSERKASCPIRRSIDADAADDRIYKTRRIRSKHLSTAEWQCIVAVENKVIVAIVVKGPVADARIVRDIGAVVSIAHRSRPYIACLELQALGKPLVKDSLQGVVVRGA